MVKCNAGSESQGGIKTDCECHLLIEDTEVLTQYGPAPWTAAKCQRWFPPSANHLIQRELGQPDG